MPRHVIVTGGSRGIGRALVEALLEAGYVVSLCSRKATAFTAGLDKRPGAFYAAADLSDPAALKSFVAAAESKLGTPYGLINCAAIAVDGVLATLTPDDIRSLTSTNVVGTLLITRAVVRRMLAAGTSGVIVNVSSVAGSRGYSGLSAYGATKAAVDGLTRGLARELGSRGIRVNSVAPGFVETDMTQSLDEAHRSQIVRRTPLGRLATTADVTGPIVFLLSDAARFITGQVIVIDGGLTT